MLSWFKKDSSLSKRKRSSIVANDWNELALHKTPRIRPQLISIEESVWYSTNYNQGENGMVEYCTKLDTVINIIKYPQNVHPRNHSCCKYYNKIYIVDGYNGQIVLFYTSTKQFIQTIKIPKIGASTSSITIYDNIHIFDGSKNRKHLIYSINDNKIHTVNGDMTTENVQNVCILRYKNKIIRFGGWNAEYKEFIDQFVMSSSIKPNQYKNIKWTIKYQYKLPHPMAKCGYILYKHYILIFGGTTIGNQYFDKIYLLDLHKENNNNNNDDNKGCNGWIELKHIKCPIPSTYLAVLNGKMVHLFSRTNKMPNWEQSVKKHYAISISIILKDYKYDVNDDNNMINSKDMTCIQFVSLSPIWGSTKINHAIKINPMKSIDTKMNDRNVSIQNNKLTSQINKSMEQINKTNLELKAMKKENKEIKLTLNVQNNLIQKYQQRIEELIKEQYQYIQQTKANEICLIQKLKTSQQQNIYLTELIEKQNNYKKWTGDQVIDWMLYNKHDLLKKYEHIQELINTKKPKDTDNDDNNDNYYE